MKSCTTGGCGAEDCGRCGMEMSFGRDIAGCDNGQTFAELLKACGYSGGEITTLERWTDENLHDVPGVNEKAAEVARRMKGGATTIMPAHAMGCLCDQCRRVVGSLPLQGDDDVNSARRDPRYTSLAAVLDEAFDQASKGKGNERHATGDRYEDQPTHWIGKMFGGGFQRGQAVKKLIEAERMEERGDVDAANRERLGAIVYTAFGILESRRKARG